MAVPSTPASAYSDQGHDTTRTDLPFLNKTSSFSGRLQGETATTVAVDGSDYFVIDVAGGSHDTTGSLNSNESLQISYNMASAGKMTISMADFGWNAFSKSGYYDMSIVSERYFIVSGSGTITIPSSYWVTPSTGMTNTDPNGDHDIALGVQVSADNTGGGVDYTGSYDLTMKVVSAATGPDLSATGQGASASAAQLGDHVFVNGRIGNAGSTDASNVKVDYYLSDDATITTSDHFLGEITISTVPAHGDVGYSVASTLSNLSPGSYYIGYVVDQTNDPNTSNNATTGTPFKVFGSTIDGLHPVYRYNDTATGDHFYTTSPTEKASIQPGVAAFVYEHTPWATPDKGAGTVDVFRFFDTVTQAHFLTSSVAERDQIIANTHTLNYEGVAFQAYSSAQDSGEFALERFYNTNSHQHTYAADAAEIALIKSGQVGAGWVDEGASFIVHHATSNMLLL